VDRAVKNSSFDHSVSWLMKRNSRTFHFRFSDEMINENNIHFVHRMEWSTKSPCFVLPISLISFEILPGCYFIDFSVQKPNPHLIPQSAEACASHSPNPSLSSFPPLALLFYCRRNQNLISWSLLSRSAALLSRTQTTLSLSRSTDLL
jgi:hypothetical protein